MLNRTIKMSYKTSKCWGNISVTENHKENKHIREKFLMKGSRTPSGNNDQQTACSTFLLDCNLDSHVVWDLPGSVSPDRPIGSVNELCIVLLLEGKTNKQMKQQHIHIHIHIPYAHTSTHTHLTHIECTHHINTYTCTQTEHTHQNCFKVKINKFKKN